MNISKMMPCRRIGNYWLRHVAAFLLIATAAFCSAGTWAYGFVGGSASPNQQISSQSANPFSVSGHSPDPDMQNSTASGPSGINCTYTPSSGESPVLAVVACIQVNASYTGLGPDQGSSCDDGYPGDNTTQYGGIGSTQSGIHWVGPIIPDSENQVSLLLKPASATGVANPHPQSKNDSAASVGFTVTCYAIEMTTTGTTVVVVNGANTDQIIVGQPFTATITTGGLPSSGDTYAWTAPAPADATAPFSNYVASLQSAAVTLFTDPTTSSLSCFFSAAGSETPSCKYHCGVLDADITVARQHPIMVMAPTINQAHTGCGMMQLLSGPPYAPNATNPTVFELWGDSYAGVTWGTLYSCWPTDPPDFGSTSGKYGYIQVKEGMGYTTWTLDGGFPYPPSIGSLWNPTPTNDNNSSPTLWSDMPGFNPLVGPYPLIYDKTFNLYIFYMPPGSGCSYVPLKCINWLAKGHCALSSTWSQGDDGSKLGPATIPVPPASFPTWSS